MENNSIQPINQEKKIVRSRIKRVALGLLVIIVLFVVAALLTKEDFEGGFMAKDGGDCNVAAIKLQGVLWTYNIATGQADEDGSGQDWLGAGVTQITSESIVQRIEDADRDDNIKAILLEIDSPGGSVVAAEEIANALKRAQKPAVAVIREMGASAAYWSATGADAIFASANSNVGSIGVTMSYLDSAEKNKKDGLSYNQLSSGKFKDAGSYDRPLSEEEKDLFMRDVKILHENFVKAVSRNRGLEIEKVGEMADGSSMTGQAALDAGLIDKIGDTYAARRYLQGKIGKDAELCW